MVNVSGLVDGHIFESRATFGNIREIGVDNFSQLISCSNLRGPVKVICG